MRGSLCRHAEIPCGERVQKIARGLCARGALYIFFADEVRHRSSARSRTLFVCKGEHRGDPRLRGDDRRTHTAPLEDTGGRALRVAAYNGTV